MTENQILDCKHIHMIGIGGSSMSGLALLMKGKGYCVTGSDKSASDLTERLQDEGIKVFIGHAEENIQDAELVVYSAAIRETNPERIGAKKAGIPQLERCELIEQLMYGATYAVCISGTNGKTTTGAMLAQAFLQSGVDPTIHLGGEFGFIGGGTKSGTDGGIILEACEYNSSFLHFSPTIAVITNISEDHLEYFGNIDNIESAFCKFTEKIPQNGWCIACGDDVRVRRVCLQANCHHITYGLNEANDLTPANLVYGKDGKAEYDAVLNGRKIGHFHVGVPGEVNMLNSLAAIAVCFVKELNLESVSRSLNSFSGVHRRFEYTGSTDGVMCYTDYGHNPIAIRNALKMAAIQPHREIWSVFQPHTFSRTKYLFEGFLTAFNDSNHVLITDIFAARETDPGDISSEMLVKAMQKSGIDAHYTPGFDDAESYLRGHWQSGDLMISHGCGDIALLNKQILKTN